MTGPSRLSGNRAIEDAAVAFVLRWEADHGRPAEDTRGTGAPADVASSGRTIEVKACGASARGQDLWLESRQRAEADTNPDFWIYIVENVRQGDPAHFRLLQIGGEDLKRLVRRAVERQYFTVPWPVAEYDALIGQRPT
ncbi:hypothetical protein SAMN05421812_107234 [Asanoa hainanensis]|uniref:Protein NO VEIN C-terminal domain-containing protein n=1 Tax=Asanoa hainanensis TaxID=560556 RepID=A0A239N5C2_9ACTN|nr:DUF3883 domain-containing protein [Asanoa hainanensis]SNT49652.1 hypothetical protein SAMN05421812_107234 [Asanoa hainanensis]